jgi:putative endonuclease
MPTKETGNFGERIAEDFLKGKGYKILDKNYCFRIFGPQKGEIDIIAKKGGIISFVEVKSLTVSQKSGGPTSSFFPESKVDFGKQRKIIRSAQSWLMENKIPLDCRWQIDVVAVMIDKEGGKAKIRHLQNAVF